MAGHSKWANIKHRKQAQDNKKAKESQKIVKEINSIIKLHGSNVEQNSKLKNIIERARASNISKAVIQKAIDNANYEANSNNFDIMEALYNSKIALVIEYNVNINKQSIVSEIRKIFNKNSCTLGTKILYLFEKKCLFTISSKVVNEENLIDWLLDFDDLDIKNTNENFFIYSSFKNKTKINEILESKDKVNDNFKFEGIGFYPIDKVKITDAEELSKISKFFDDINNVKGINKIYSNLDETK